MKKTFFFTLITIGLLFAATVRVDALTTVSLNPVTVSVQQGQQFTLLVTVDPAGTPNYTAKVELGYPADLVEVRSFTFVPGWLPLSQPGYDLIDNTAGTLVKTAGYPGGVSSSVTFGTVILRAKSTGTAVITVGSSSLMLDAQNQNVINTQPAKTTVTISGVSVIPPTQREVFEIPDAIPSEYTFGADLRQGDSSIDVAYLQLCLGADGVYSDDVTGYFGPLTKNAVIDFQEKYFDDILAPWGFTQGTGLVSTTTREKLNTVCVQEEVEVPEEVPKEEKKGTPLFDIIVEPVAEEREVPAGVGMFVLGAASLIILVTALVFVYRKLRRR